MKVTKIGVTKHVSLVINYNKIDNIVSAEAELEPGENEASAYESLNQKLKDSLNDIFEQDADFVEMFKAKK